MPISSYSTDRDTNAGIAPGNIRAKDFSLQQIVNSIRQLMADLAGLVFTDIIGYEEGTWTPTFSPAAGAFGAITYDYQGVNTTYTKIGNECTLHLIMRTDAITVGTASGQVRIAGIPFTAKGSMQSSGATGYGATWAVNRPRHWIIAAGGVLILLYTDGTAASAGVCNVTDLGTGADANDIRTSLTYATV